MNNEPYRELLKLPCPECGGLGEVQGKIVENGGTYDRCPTCNGTGYRLPTDAEIDDWFAVEGMGWHKVTQKVVDGRATISIDRAGFWCDEAENPMVRYSGRWGWHPREDANQALMLVADDEFEGGAINKKQYQSAFADDERFFAKVSGHKRVYADTFAEAMCLARAKSIAAGKEATDG